MYRPNKIGPSMLLNHQSVFGVVTQALLDASIGVIPTTNPTLVNLAPTQTCNYLNFRSDGHVNLAIAAVSTNFAVGLLVNGENAYQNNFIHHTISGTFNLFSDQQFQASLMPIVGRYNVAPAANNALLDFWTPAPCQTYNNMSNAEGTQIHASCNQQIITGNVNEQVQSFLETPIFYGWLCKFTTPAAASIQFEGNITGHKYTEDVQTWDPNR